MDRVKSKLYSTSRWKTKLRPLALARSYLCMYCYQRESTVVDHLSGCTDDNCYENLVPTCKRCHDRKTTLIDVKIRLLQLQTFHDALVFAGRISKHCFDIPEHVLEMFSEKQKNIYQMLKANSLYKEVTDFPDADPYDMRYVVAVNELWRNGKS